MSLLAATGVGVRLAGREVLRAVDFPVAGGELTGIVGPNGAGKSTLARVLAGVLASTGAVAIDGVPLVSLRPAARARAIAYLPQGATLAWPLTVARLAGLGRLPHLGPMSRIGADDTAAIDRAMDRADVAHLADRIATELSGGERARALLARALAVEARVLIIDEPLAALDPGHALGVMELLRAEARRGVAVVAVMHELTLAARFCDRLVLLHDGRVVADGVPEAVLDAANLRSVYGVEAWRGEVETGDGARERLIVPLSRVPIDATQADACPQR